MTMKHPSDEVLVIALMGALVMKSAKYDEGGWTVVWIVMLVLYAIGVAMRARKEAA